MYTILVDFALVGGILALGVLLFAASVFIVLVDAGSQAVGRAAKKYGQALARLQWQAPRPQLEPDKVAVRARLRV